jgi:hypothetical protein
MFGFLSAAFVAGLVGSPHCIGMCGGFAVLCGGRVTDTMFWHLGRLTSYATLGALAGAFGSLIPGPSWVAAVVSFGLMVWFAAALAGFVPEPRLVIPGLKRLGSAVAGNPAPYMRYAFGIVNGFLPCGLVYATAIRRKARWRWWRSASEQRPCSRPLRWDCDEWSPAISESGGWSRRPCWLQASGRSDCVRGSWDRDTCTARNRMR